MKYKFIAVCEKRASYTGSHFLVNSGKFLHIQQFEILTSFLKKRKSILLRSNSRGFFVVVVFLLFVLKTMQ